jgi:serine/threonine protein kinase
LAGDGGQAQVFLAEKDNKQFIVKIYFPHNQALTYFTREANILGRLHSNHIIKMIENFPEGKVTLGN